MPDRYNWEGHLVVGVEVEDSIPPKETFIIVEVKEGERQVYNKLFEVAQPLKYKEAYLFTESYLLPNVRGREVVIWLWNNSDKPVNFNNFRVNIIK